MLTKSKLNSRLFSISRTDWHGNKWERIITILKEKYSYEKMKENMTNMNETLEEKGENMRLNSVSSRN